MVINFLKKYLDRDLLWVINYFREITASQIIFEIPFSIWTRSIHIWGNLCSKNQFYQFSSFWFCQKITPQNLVYCFQMILRESSDAWRDFFEEENLKENLPVTSCLCSILLQKNKPQWRISQFRKMSRRATWWRRKCRQMSPKAISLFDWRPFSALCFEQKQLFKFLDLMLLPLLNPGNFKTIRSQF